MTNPIVSIRGSKITLVAGPDEYVVELDIGSLRVHGIAGGSFVGCSFRQFVQTDANPGALEFLRRHDVVDIRYDTDETSLGAAQDRTLILVGCKLRDAIMVEEQGALAMEYLFGGQGITGSLFAVGG